MSVHVSRLVWDHSAADLSARLVLLALAEHANDSGYCYPKVETLARMARLSERQTRRALGTLEALGELATIRGTGRGHVSVYAVLCGLAPDVAAERVSGLHPYLERVTNKVDKLAPFSPERVPSCPIKGDMAIADLPVVMPDQHENHHGNHHGGGGGGGAHAKNSSDPAALEATLRRIGVGPDRARALATQTDADQLAYLEEAGRQKGARDLAGWVVSGITNGRRRPPATPAPAAAPPDRSPTYATNRPARVSPPPFRPREGPETPRATAENIEKYHGKEFADELRRRSLARLSALQQAAGD